MTTHLIRRMRLRLLPLVVVLLLGLPGWAAPDAAAQPDTAALQRLLDDIVAAGAPGAVAYVQDEAGNWSGASGLADLASRRPMDVDVRFRIGSVTKTYVATVVLQLVEEERLSLDDTVESRLPGLLPYGGQVTVRQLLNHTSGVPEYLRAVPVADYYSGAGPGRFRAWTPRELVELVAGQPPAFEPATAWGYSNTNYVLLGMIFEQVTRRSLQAEIDRRILRPLAIRDTSFPIGRTPTPSNRLRGYTIRLGPDGTPTPGPLVDVTALDTSFAWAAGNMIVDANSIGQFYSALLKGRLLPAPLLAEMKTGVPTGTAGFAYGAGLIIADLPCGRAFGHTGGIPGFSTFAVSSEDGRRQVVLFFNVNQASAEVRAVAERAVVAAYCASAPKPTPPRPGPTPPAPPPNPLN